MQFRGPGLGASVWTVFVFTTLCLHGLQGLNPPMGQFMIMDAATCPRATDVIWLYNFTTEKVGNVHSGKASGDAVSPRRTETVKKFSFRMTQCPTGGQCKHFYTMRFPGNICPLLADTGAFWAGIMSSSTPIFHCPLEKTTYHFRNASLNFGKFMVLFQHAAPQINREADWLGKLEAVDDESRPLVCLNVKLKYKPEKDRPSGR